MATYRKAQPLKICLLLRDVAIGGNSRIGDYVGLPPHKADALARTGNVAVVTDTINPADIRKAGGWRSLLESNPKLRAISTAEETRLVKQVEKYMPPVAPVDNAV
jgi:hypothetical protein